jgi:hypothetical protein
MTIKREKNMRIIKVPLQKNYFILMTGRVSTKNRKKAKGYDKNLLHSAIETPKSSQSATTAILRLKHR